MNRLVKKLEKHGIFSEPYETLVGVNGTSSKLKGYKILLGSRGISAWVVGSRIISYGFNAPTNINELIGRFSAK